MDVTSGWQRDLFDVGKVMAAYILALPVGWSREEEEHSVGVRTIPIVAMASCGYLLLTARFDIAAQSRVMQGLVAGMGFIGGGAILKIEGSVRGVATAATIWNIGAVGAAVAQERWVLAIALSALNLFALRVLLPIKIKLDNRRNFEEALKRADKGEPPK